jgi:uncharacterized protein (UPF0147 family)
MFVEAKPIVNVKRAEIITDETVPRTFSFETATEAQYEPVISEGKEEILRTKNTIHAMDKTEDIQYGSNITLTDNKFAAEIMAIIDGGTVKKDETQKITGYSAPPVGVALNRIPFTLNVYSEEKDTDGNVLGYIKFSFPGCKGTPAKFSLKDGSFMAPEYKIQSRPGANELPYDVDFITTLPVA